MTLKLYDDNGYLNIPEITNIGIPLIFIAAARGTGKTYGICKDTLINNINAMLLRRTQTEAELQFDHDSCSFYEPAADLGIEYTITRAGKNNARIWYNDSSTFIAGLSTFANIRGAFNFRDVTRIFYDEFIPEPHVKKIKDEGFALANLYESVNRNRELQGRTPVQLICAANSMNLANDYFIYFGLIRDAEEMLKTGEEYRIIGDKILIIPRDSPISRRKGKTVLYKNVNQEFSDMALKNEFILNDFTYVQKNVLREYQVLMRVGSLTIYKHKSNNEYFVNMVPAETKKIYTDSYSDLARFRRDQWRLSGRYLDGKIRFADYYSLSLFEKYFDIK